jgi:hypothetical protein
MITVSELNDERYIQIDSKIDTKLVDKFIDSTTDLQTEMLKHNISAEEMYSYLLTIMLNQC